MKAIVLSSGGLDSTTCLSLAVKEYGKENVSAVSIWYGQKLDKELECAKSVAEHYGVDHYTFDISEVFKFSDCTLLKHGNDIVMGSYESQNDGVISSYVPFRNGLFISICTVLAQSIYKDEECEVILGNHQSDFAYADCSENFIAKMSDAINEGTYHKVTLRSPLNLMSKADVVSIGLKLETPYEKTWSCYVGGDKPCRTCASCIEREKAFGMNGVTDPLI